MRRITLLHAIFQQLRAIYNSSWRTICCKKVRLNTCTYTWPAKPKANHLHVTTCSFFFLWSGMSVTLDPLFITRLCEQILSLIFKACGCENTTKSCLCASIKLSLSKHACGRGPCIILPQRMRAKLTGLSPFFPHYYLRDWRPSIKELHKYW